MRKLTLIALSLVALAACATTQPKPVEAQSETPATEALPSDTTPAPDQATTETAPSDSTTAPETTPAPTP